MKQAFQSISAAGLSLALIWGLSCGPSRWKLFTTPDRIRTVEGYASLRIQTEEGASRTKFSFVFSLPQRGHIEVSDFLGRTIYQILVLPEKAFFVVPSRKLYWTGREENIIEKFLGFRLSMEEAVRFLTGQWHHSSLPGSPADWTFQYDENGRVVSGKRDGLCFVIEEFLGDSNQVQSLTFSHSLSRGSLKILQLQFNQEVIPDVFSYDFTERYSETSWEHIRDLLNHAD
ncbi:MAG: lipoprotein insertase outer membrane protein LolB [Candidatus Aminicenantes bacterium]